MGQEIVYCAACQIQLRGADFEKQRAFRIEGQAYCASCVRALTKAAEPHGQSPSAADSPSQASRSQIPTATPRSAHRAIAEGNSSQTALIGIAVAAAVMVLGLLAVIGNGRGSPPAPRAATVTHEPAPPVLPREVPVPKVGGEAPRTEERTAGDASPAAREMAREIAELAEKARALAGKEEFKAALDLYESARSRRELPEWKSLIEAKRAGLHREVNRLFDGLKEEGAEARRTGRADAVSRLRDRVGRWGLADLVAALDAHLAAIPEPKPVSPAFAEYRSRWTKAAALAAGRDFDAAASEIVRAAQGTVDPDVLRESAADAQEFRAMGPAVVEARAALAASAPGLPLRLSVREGAGPPTLVAGKVTRADSNRIELEGPDGNPHFVELIDVSAASLAERLEGKREILTLLAALEGTGSATLPEKYAAYSKGALERLPPRSPREDEARRLLHAAELEFRSIETLAGAVEKYRTLIKDYAETRIVGGDGAEIRKRSEAARDYFFGLDGLKGTGAFSLSSMPKVEAAWASGGVSDPSHAVVNFVEFQFPALAEVAYRCWIYAGACCRETFVFSVQATELTTVNPRKPAEKLPAGPGDPQGVPIRQSALLLKSTHAGHGNQARQWGWVPVPLPKFTAAGLKKVRLLTESSGFAIAAVSVSALRPSPPADAELKREFERAKGIATTPPEPGLVAWFKFDDGVGTAASDSSGNGHLGTLAQGATWGKGKFGGCVVLDGIDDHVRVLPSALLNGVTTQLTLAAWVWRSSDQDGWRCIATRQRGSSWDDQWGLVLGKDVPHFHMAAATVIGGKAATAAPGGKWFHMAATYDGTVARLYVDGKVASSTNVSGNLLVDAPRPLILGAGRNDPTDAVQEALHGMLDDVRVYNRCLSLEEIRVLLQGPVAPVATPAATLPVDARAWRPLFDGKTLAFLQQVDRDSWQVDNGAICAVPGKDGAAQSQEQFEDGDVRFRFEVKDASHLWFAVRQGEGSVMVMLKGSALKTLDAKAHEVIFSCRGDAVTATLDGRPVELERNGQPRRGHLQFNRRDGTVRILSIEIRDAR